MTTTGNFKIFLNGKEVTEQDIINCNEVMSVTVDNLSVFYSFLPKIEKDKYPTFYKACMNKISKLLEEEAQINPFIKFDYTNPDNPKVIPAEKDKTEKLVFTTFEKELTSEKQQGHLSTRHKSISGQAHEPINDKQQESISNFYLDEILAEKEKKALYPLTPDECFKVGDVYWKSKKLTGEVGHFNFSDSEKATEKRGEKTNKNKPQLSLLFKQFPKALEAIVRCSEYGHKKYKETDADYLNYTRVYGGSKTYADASLRHRLEQGNDLESKLPHQFHVAWNSLAELELWIEENKTK